MCEFKWYVVTRGLKWLLQWDKISADHHFWAQGLQKRPFIWKEYLMTWMIFSKTYCWYFQKGMTVALVVVEFSMPANFTIANSEIWTRVLTHIIQNIIYFGLKNWDNHEKNLFCNKMGSITHISRGTEPTFNRSKTKSLMSTMYIQ